MSLMPHLLTIENSGTCRRTLEGDRTTHVALSADGCQTVPTPGLIAIALNFGPEYYGQVLPRLVLEFGQATEQRGASLFWKVGNIGVILDAGRGKGEHFLVFMTSDASIDRGRTN